MSKELLDLGEVQNDGDAKFQGCGCCAITRFHLGDFGTARTYAERALALYDPAYPSLATWPVHFQSFAGMFAFRSLTYLGFLDRARQCREEHMALARQRNHAHTLAMLLGTSLACDVHMHHDPATLVTSVDDLVALCAEHSLPYWAGVATMLRGWCLSGLGRSDEAIPLMTAALTDYRATGSVTVVPMFLTEIAEVLCKARRTHEGLEKLDEAIR